MVKRILVLDNVSEALQASCEAHWNIKPAICDAHWHSTKATQEAHTTEFLLEDGLLLWALVNLKLHRQTIYFHESPCNIGYGRVS